MGFFNNIFKGKKKDDERDDSVNESVEAEISESLENNELIENNDLADEAAENSEAGLDSGEEIAVNKNADVFYDENTENINLNENGDTESILFNGSGAEDSSESKEDTKNGETVESVGESREIENSEQKDDATVKKGFFARLKEGLGKTRKNILGSVDSVLGAFTKIDEDLFEELEEALIMADLGVQTTMDICDNLRKRVKKEGVTDPSHIKTMLSEEISGILLDGCESELELETPSVVLVIGVNGVGKTTTIGKIASLYKREGKTVMLAAADTFRAAAIDQLAIWGERCGVDVIKHEETSDPAAVVFDAVNAAKSRKTDILICDTAGRLHNKKNLMEELKKISKVIEREYPHAHKEVFLVLDATTGQNALQQAKLFKEAADITGIVLTKLDGTAKGGIVVAIKSELKIPVRFIGVGEGIDDLQKFDAESFSKALFENDK